MLYANAMLLVAGYGMMYFLYNNQNTPSDAQNPTGVMDLTTQTVAPVAVDGASVKPEKWVPHVAGYEIFRRQFKMLGTSISGGNRQQGIMRCGGPFQVPLGDEISMIEAHLEGNMDTNAVHHMIVMAGNPAVSSTPGVKD